MKNEPKIEVGYPVFLLKKDDRSILPGIVCGQITNKNLSTNGIQEEVSLKIMIGPAKSRKMITTNKLPEENFEIFGNLHELKNKIFEDLLETIGRNVKLATSNLKAWYQDEISLEILTSALQEKDTEDDGEYIDVPNKTFKELAGEEAARKVAAKPTKKKPAKPSKKKPIPKPKNEGYFEPVIHEEDELTVSPITAETKIRIKIPDGNGGFTYMMPEDLEKSDIDLAEITINKISQDSQ